MDDFMKEFLGSTENQEEYKAAEEAAPAPDETPSEEAAPAASEAPEAPVVPVSEPIPAPKPAQVFTHVDSVPGDVPPQPEAPAQKAVFYQPPVYQNSAAMPPVYQPQPAYANPTGMPAAIQPKPKKRKTAKIVIALIAVLCAAVAFTGVAYAINHMEHGSSSGNSNPIESFINDGDDEKNKTDNNDNTDNDDASASVNGSESAATKDKNGDYTVAGVAKAVKDSCVGITVYTKQDAFNYFYGYGEQNNASGEEVASGEGSGVIMSEANGKTYIMTCAHVIADGSSFKVTLDNDKEYDARMVGYDSQTDIGVLVIDATGLQVASFGDSKDILVGEDCVAIGCPGGLQFKNSVTKGVVSALDVPVSSSIGYNNECIQVDAAINPGNSGGALFNMQGQVIGINSSKIASTEYEGMGFAVPSNTAVETANSLIKNGYVKGRAKLGITYNTLSNYTSAQSILQALAEKGYKDAEGTMVIDSLSDDSDLNGKVEKYDMIVAVNGNTLTSVDVLTSVLSKSKPGDTVKLTVARIENNNIKTFEVTCKLIEAKE